MKHRSYVLEIGVRLWRWPNLLILDFPRAKFQLQKSVVRITGHVKIVDMMTARSLKSVSGEARVKVEIRNGRLDCVSP